MMCFMLQWPLRPRAHYACLHSTQFNCHGALQGHLDEWLSSVVNNTIAKAEATRKKLAANDQVRADAIGAHTARAEAAALTATLDAHCGTLKVPVHVPADIQPTPRKSSREAGGAGAGAGAFTNTPPCCACVSLRALVSRGPLRRLALASCCPSKLRRVARRCVAVPSRAAVMRSSCVCVPPAHCVCNTPPPPYFITPHAALRLH